MGQFDAAWNLGTDWAQMAAESGCQPDTAGQHKIARRWRHRCSRRQLATRGRVPPVGFEPRCDLLREARRRVATASELRVSARLPLVIPNLGTYSARVTRCPRNTRGLTAAVT